MKETAPENDAVSIEQGGEPNSIIPDNSFDVPFNDLDLPLGQHFEHFWQDFIEGELPNEVVERHDKRSKMYRSAYSECQSKGISTYISDLRITLVVTFEDRPEEWEVEL